MNHHPRAGAVGGYVNEKYLPRQFPTAASLIQENLGLGSAPSRSGQGRYETPAEQRKAIPVDQPAAAALMIRRDAYDEVGGFDEQFSPAWYEDVDFCRRLKAAGWEIYFARDAQFQHQGGYSAQALGSEAFARAYYSNQVRYARKHLGSAATAAIRASIAVGMIERIVVRPRNAPAYAKVLWRILGG
jgi:GT2 family glycosyltransferase